MATDDFSELLDELTAPHARPWNPASRRRTLAERLPRLVDTAIARGHSRLGEARSAIPGSVWRALVDAQAGATGEGWAEVVASVAVAIDLLRQELPQEVRAHIMRFPQIEAAFRRLLLPFERYALLVGGPGQVVRAHVDAFGAFGPLPLCPGRIEDQPGLAWVLDAPMFDGRSHTLLLALLALDAQKRVLPDDVAIAATGELAEDGLTVRPVNGFEEKVAAWRAAHPHGLLISAPPPTAPPMSVTAPREPERHGGDDWIVGGTLDEIIEKLRMFGRAHREARRVTTWNGSVRTLDQLAPWQFESRGVAGTTSTRWRFPFRSGGCVETQVAEALSGEEAPQGIVIRGAPGTGKSLLLEVLHDAFIAGASGRLGYAVTVRAADLARDLDGESRDGALLTAWAGLSSEALHALGRMGRLFVLIDGLDEIDDASLARIGGWLRKSGTRYLATARPTRTLDSMPAYGECEIASLSLDAARALLRGEGRADLAALVPDRVDHRREAQLPAEVTALLDTPLGISLLAAATSPSTDLRDINPAALYERVFESLLAHGARSGRLEPEAARSLQRGGRGVGARLALRWLRDGREISREAVRVEVESAGYLGESADRLVEALEFGHLLVPGAEGFSFAHRTLAEWLAACGLKDLVERAVVGAPLRYAEGVEEETLDALLPRGALAESPWWQTALFYAPFARAPDRLLRRVLDGPLSVRAGDMRRRSEERFAAALDLASLCRWTTAGVAREAWAIFARALSVPLDDDSVPRSVLLAERPKPDFVRERFFSAVAVHLPATLDALCDLAGLDERWRKWFRERPERLLRAVPRERLAAFDARLRRLDIEARSDILRRHVELGERVAWETHAALRAEPPLVIVPEAYGSQGRWEEVLFDYWIAVGERVPPAWVLARARAWPNHLQGSLLRWLNATPDECDESIRDRVEALEHFVIAVVAEREELLAELRKIALREDHVKVFQAMHERMDASPPDSAQGTLRELLAEAGVEIPRSRSFHASVPEDARTLVDGVRAWDRRHRAMSNALRELRPERREALLGRMFADLRPGSPERGYIVVQCLALDRVPPEATVDELLDATDKHGQRMAWKLLPNEQRVPTSSQTARWRELAATGRGKRRLFALEWCAHMDGTDLTTVLLVATPGDDEFAALRREHLVQSASRLTPGQVAQLDPPVISALPLRARVKARTANWKEDVLAALDGEADEARREACDIVREERLLDAKPHLVARFSAAPEGAVCAALEALVEPTDRDLIRRLLGSEPPHWAPGERLLGLMEVDDLPTVLSRTSTPWRIQEAFEARLILLGRSAHQSVRDMPIRSGPNASARSTGKFRACHASRGVPSP